MPRVGRKNDPAPERATRFRRFGPFVNGVSRKIALNQNQTGFALARNFVRVDNETMTAAAVIEEIKRLPRAEQSRVIQFVNELERKRQITGKELEDLAKRMVEAKDPAEADRLREEIVRGFYGGEPHA